MKFVRKEDVMLKDIYVSFDVIVGNEVTNIIIKDITGKIHAIYLKTLFTWNT